MTEAIEAALHAALDPHGDPGATARVLERVRALPATGRPEDLLEAILTIAKAEWQQKVNGVSEALAFSLARRTGLVEQQAHARAVAAHARQKASAERAWIDGRLTPQ